MSEYDDLASLNEAIEMAKEGLSVSKYFDVFIDVENHRHTIEEVEVECEYLCDSSEYHDATDICEIANPETLEWDKFNVRYSHSHEGSVVEYKLLKKANFSMFTSTPGEKTDTSGWMVWFHHKIANISRIYFVAGGDGGATSSFGTTYAISRNDDGKYFFSQGTKTKAAR